jgi:hypothetical protein
MTNCWNAEPKDRPDFMEIADIIGGLLESNVRQVCLQNINFLNLFNSSS